MNAAVRAVTRAALARGAEVFGVRNGYAGLLADSLKPLQARDVGGIVQHGGTVLGSARCPEFAEPSGRSAALRNLAARGIDALVVIGGNGSQTGSAPPGGGRASPPGGVPPPPPQRHPPPTT